MTIPMAPVLQEMVIFVFLSEGLQPSVNDT